MLVAFLTKITGIVRVTCAMSAVDTMLFAFATIIAVNSHITLRFRAAYAWIIVTVGVAAPVAVFTESAGASYSAIAVSVIAIRLRTSTRLA